jgi:hypothetical protein
MVASLLILLLLAVAGIPLTVQGDGTLEGHVRIVIGYTMGFASLLLGLAALWAGALAVSQESRRAPDPAAGREAGPPVRNLARKVARPDGGQHPAARGERRGHLRPAALDHPARPHGGGGPRAPDG